ncbi:hypothetical protein NP233_g6683 [Leucocoprinus birnbaumii]|uniref:Uncharacterized protein n=1 Tax=Leucocoprinus birnbaumii TaxID=56174 RepID=A0AAD5YTG3_9AGAR|nr:hypothetical protein NP233_g6683 [Leucocoprinus birnbaumii]
MSPTEGFYLKGREDNYRSPDPDFFFCSSSDAVEEKTGRTGSASWEKGSCEDGRVSKENSSYILEVMEPKKAASALGDVTNSKSLKITIPVLPPRTSFQFVGNIQNDMDNQGININDPQVGRAQANGDVFMHEDPRNVPNLNLIPRVSVQIPQTDGFVPDSVPPIAAPLNNADHCGNMLPGDDMIDPRLRNASVAPQVTQAHAPPENTQPTPQSSQALDLNAQDAQANEGEDDDGWCSDDPDDLADDEEASAARPKKKKSQKEKEKEDYGFILGLMRGSEVLADVKRPRALPKPLTKSSFMSRRFRRALPLIVARLEALAHQTGCWIYLAAQHTTAINPFMHYVSPRLKREGATQLNQIHAQVSKLMRSLIESRRVAITEKNMELEETQAKLDDASKQIVEQDKLLKKQQELIDCLMRGTAQ